LTLVSKIVQSMGNIGTLTHKSSSSHGYKENYLAPLNEQLIDDSHIRDVKTVSLPCLQPILLQWFMFPFPGSSI
jgi:hypothetical protein